MHTSFTMAVKSSGDLLGVALAEEMSGVVNHVARDARRLEHVVQASPHLAEIALAPFEQAQRRTRVGDDRRERLGELVGDRRRELAERRELRGAHQLELRILERGGRALLRSDVSNDAEKLVRFAADHPRLELPQLAGRKRHLVFDDHRFFAVEHTTDFFLEHRRERRRQDVTHFPPEKLRRRDEEQRFVSRVVVHVDAVSRLDEHQIGKRAQDRVVARFRPPAPRSTDEKRRDPSRLDRDEHDHDAEHRLSGHPPSPY